MLAVNRGDTTIVNLLCGAEADLDIEDNMYRATALHKATMIGRTSIMETLVRKGADKVSRSASELTLLMIACGYGNMQAFRLLIGRGADPGKKSKNFNVELRQ